MIAYLSTLILGMALGYCLCMFRVNELQDQVNQLKLDAFHKAKKRQHIGGAIPDGARST